MEGKQNYEKSVIFQHQLKVSDPWFKFKLRKPTISKYLVRKLIGSH